MKTSSESSKEVKDIERKPRRFSSVKTGVRSLIFIKTTLETPEQLTKMIFDDVIKTGKRKCRHIIRLLPIQLTCKAYLNDIQKAVGTLLSKLQSELSSSQAVTDGKDPFSWTYAVQFKTRNNSQLSREDVIDAICDVIRGMFPLATVNLSKPSRSFVVEVLQTVCCLSILTDYTELKKYNIREIIAPPNTDKNA